MFDIFAAEKIYFNFIERSKVSHGSLANKAVYPGERERAGEPLSLITI